MLKFTKMHGLGNDFIVIDGISAPVNLSEDKIRQLADRHLGIGFDQCLIVEPSLEKNIDFKYKIYNANGKEVGQCGNGARCLASFIKAKNLSLKNSYTVATKTTIMHLDIEDDKSVTVMFDKPNFEPDKIPLLYSLQQELYTIPLDFDKTCAVHALSLGNPHAILVVDSLDDEFIAKYGKAISQHRLFPEEVNVGFMQIMSKSHIQLRVYERGCGETQACGSGAVAAAAVGILFHGLDDTVVVNLLGGCLKVTWPKEREHIFLNGSTQFVFEGEIEEL